MLEDKLVLPRPEIIHVKLKVRFFARSDNTHIHPFHIEFWPEESDPIVLSSSCIKMDFVAKFLDMGGVPNDAQVSKSFLAPSFMYLHSPCIIY